VSTKNHTSKSQKGISLIEILVAMAIMGGLVLSLMKFLSLTSKTQAKVDVISDVTRITREINALISDPNRCFLTFTEADGSLNRTPESIVSAYDRDANEELIIQGRKFDLIDSANGERVGTANLEILDYELVTQGTDHFLQITFKNKVILKEKNENVIRKINMFVDFTEVNGQQVFRGCRSLSSESTTIWTRGSGSDIFYTGGNVGVNTTAPEESLHVVGKIVAEGVTAKTFFYQSDRQLKTNIEGIIDPIGKVLSLQGRSFSWKKDNKHDYGFIAQEVEKVIPEIVRKDVKRDILTVDYVKVVPILIEAIRKQQIEIEKFKNEIQNFKERNQ
jgi:prepilin-type N-terminal cleavage/methylation domain-containing protein